MLLKCQIPTFVTIIIETQARSLQEKRYTNLKKKKKPTGEVAVDTGMRGSVIFPGLELNTFERNEDDPSGIFIVISSPSRLPHFEQELFINKRKSLLWDFIQHNIIWKKKQVPKLTECHHVFSLLFLN